MEGNDWCLRKVIIEDIVSNYFKSNQKAVSKSLFRLCASYFLNFLLHLLFILLLNYK